MSMGNSIGWNSKLLDSFDEDETANKDEQKCLFITKYFLHLMKASSCPVSSKARMYMVTIKYDNEKESMQT